MEEEEEELEEGERRWSSENGEFSDSGGGRQIRALRMAVEYVGMD